MSPGELLAAGSELLYREGYYLDRQQWQDWLALYLFLLFKKLIAL